MAGPIEERVRCPICQGEQVQLACVLCFMPNRQIAYMDHRGLRLYETNMPGGFVTGVTMVFRCSANHIVYRNLSPEGDGTLETSLTAYAAPAVLDGFRPIWGSSSQDDGVLRDKERAGE